MEALAYLYSALTYEEACRSQSINKKKSPVYLNRPSLKKVF